MKHKIHCTIEGFTEEARSILEAIGEVVYARPSKENLQETTIMVVQLGVTIDRDIIDAAPHLQYIASATTGLDHIDVDYAESKDIKILSLKGETEFLNSITATAELALGLMIALARHVPAAHRSVLDGTWNREAFRGHSLHGKTLGVVGYGRLGKMVAHYGEALGMKVIFTDPDVKGGVTPETLLQQSDVVSLHMHLTEETEECICAEALKAMKPTALLINTSRGKVVDEKALMEALGAGEIAGYATDVIADELSFTPESAQNPLIEYARTHDNVIITPHIGGTTTEAREATDIFIAKKLRDTVSA